MLEKGKLWSNSASLNRVPSSGSIADIKVQKWESIFAWFVHMHTMFITQRKTQCCSQQTVTVTHSVDRSQLDFSFAFTDSKLHYLLSSCSAQLPWRLLFYNRWAMKTKVPKQSEKLLFFSNGCSVQLINHSQHDIAEQFQPILDQ